GPTAYEHEQGEEQNERSAAAESKRQPADTHSRCTARQGTGKLRRYQSLHFRQQQQEQRSSDHSRDGTCREKRGTVPAEELHENVGYQKQQRSDGSGRQAPCSELLPAAEPRQHGPR